jgi:hypothetical protein
VTESDQARDSVAEVISEDRLASVTAVADAVTYGLVPKLLGLAYPTVWVGSARCCDLIGLTCVRWDQASL